LEKQERGKRERKKRKEIGAKSVAGEERRQKKICKSDLPTNAALPGIVWVPSDVHHVLIHIPERHQEGCQA
jgi:hypothetical protein